MYSQETAVKMQYQKLLKLLMRYMKSTCLKNGNFLIIYS